MQPHSTTNRANRANRFQAQPSASSPTTDSSNSPEDELKPPTPPAKPMRPFVDLHMYYQHALGRASKTTGDFSAAELRVSQKISRGELIFVHTQAELEKRRAELSAKHQKDMEQHARDLRSFDRTNWLHELRNPPSIVKLPQILFSGIKLVPNLTKIFKDRRESLEYAKNNS